MLHTKFSLLHTDLACVRNPVRFGHVQTVQKLSSTGKKSVRTPHRTHNFFWQIEFADHLGYSCGEA